MCVSVITVIASFSSSTLGGMAGQHHLDTHSTYMAITSHGGVSWLVSNRGSFEMIMWVLCLCFVIGCMHLPPLPLPRSPSFLVTFFLSDFSLCFYFLCLSSFFVSFSASSESNCFRNARDYEKKSETAIVSSTLRACADDGHHTMCVVDRCKDLKLIYM